MNRKAKLAASLLLAVVMAGVLNASGGPVYTVLDASSLRGGPDSNYAAVATLPAGERVVEEARQGDWIKVRLSSGKQEGWLYAAAVEQVTTTSTGSNNGAQQGKRADAGADSVAPAVAGSQKSTVIQWNDAVFGHKNDAPTAVNALASTPASTYNPAGSTAPVNKPSVEKASALHATVRAAANRTNALNIVAQGHAQTVRATDIFNGDQPVAQAHEPSVAIKDMGRALNNGSAVTHAGPKHAPMNGSELLTVSSDSGQEITTKNLLDERAVVPTPKLAEKAPSKSAGKHVSPESGAVILKNAEPALVSAPVPSTSVAPVIQASTGKTVVQSTTMKSPVNAGQPIKQPIITGKQVSPESGTVVLKNVEPALVSVPVPSTKAAPVIQAPTGKPAVQSAAMSIPANADQSIKQTTNIRSGPGALYPVMGWAGQGAAIVLLAQQGTWVKVRMQDSGRVGWIDATSLHEPALAERATAENTAGKAASPAPQVMKLKPVNLAAGRLTTPASAEILSVKAPEIKPAPLYFFKQTSNLLAGPGTQFVRIGWVGRDESATVINSKGRWRRVNMTISGKRGWVPDSLLAVALPTGKIVLAKAKASVAPKASKAGLTVLSESMPARALETATLRAQAGMNSAMAGWVAKGDMVTILEKQGAWVRVTPQLAGMHGGWIRAEQLSLIESSNMTGSIIGGGQPLSAYSDRISHGKAFNYSYAALDEARYRIPVEQIEVTMDDDDLKALFRKGRYDKSAFPVNIIHDKRKFRGIVEVLGSSTRVFRKKSLRIKLDKDGGLWFGKRNIALQSMASDKSMMREWLSWKLMKAMGMKVPDVHFTRVNFNHGEQIGLYVSIEWVGKQFLAANGLDPKGEFYQPIDASHCGDLYTAKQMDVCFAKITPQGGDFSSISKMAKTITDASSADMDSVLAANFHDESVLNWITANALVTNGDSYNKNYWLYHQPHGGKWTLIPWDYNLTLGRTYDPYADYPFTIFNDNFQYYYAPDVGAGNPLKDKSLRNPILRARIEAKIKHLTGMQANGPEATFGWFSPTVMKARIANLAAVLGKQVPKDTLITYGKKAFTKASKSIGYYAEAHDYFLKYKLFGSYVWSPAPPNPPLINFPLPTVLYAQGVIKAGDDHIHMVDPGWAYFVADLKLDKPLKRAAKFKVNVEGGVVPRHLPRTMLAGQCIRRSWAVSAETPGTDVRSDVMFEYIQENSKRTEVPQTLHENMLQLWMLDGNRWKPLKTEVNQYSNTLTVRNVEMKYGKVRRFVACSPF